VRKSAIGAALLALSLAMTAAAADNKPVTFTKSGMEEAAYPWRFVDSPITPIDARSVRWHFGWVELKTPLGAFRLIYLPLMMPLHGAPGSRDWNQMPNAFELTNMQIPQRPPKEDPPANVAIEIKKDEQQ
jgi:hypothetical protein